MWTNQHRSKTSTKANDRKESMKNSLILFLVLIAFLSSCVSTPPQKQEAPAPAPAPSANTDKSDALQTRAQELVTGQPGGLAGSQTTATASPATTSTGTSTAASNDVPAFTPGVLSQEEIAFLENHLNRLQYMVYYDPSVDMQAHIAKTAIAQANRYLIEQLRLTVMDMDQLERLKADQQMAYQAETGGSINIMQYLAQKYNADIYVEIALVAETEVRNNVPYASARGSMKMYDTSTGQLLGTVPFQSPQVRNTSLDAAVTNAVTASVWAGMPRMIEQSRNLIRGSMADGVRYELTLQNPPDGRGMLNFRRALERYFRVVESGPSSATEAKITISTFQSKNRVENAIYDAAERAGMMDMYPVYSRGRLFVVNSGL